jgi:glucokinase
LGNRAGMVGAAKLAWQLLDLRGESIMAESDPKSGY